MHRQVCGSSCSSLSPLFFLLLVHLSSSSQPPHPWTIKMRNSKRTFTMPSSSTMSSSNPVIPNVPLNMDLVTQLIGLQGQQTGSMNQGQYSPQLVLEHRLKLNQLQQLQLQNQILQQQVSPMLLTFPTHSHGVNSFIADLCSSNF